MEIIIQPRHLTNLISQVSGTVSKMTGAISGIRFTAAGGTVTLSSYDFDAASQAEAVCDVVQPGEVLVPGRLLTAIGKSLPSKPVRITSDGSRVTMTCGPKTVFKLPVMPLDEFPSLPPMPKVAGTVQGLGEAVNRVSSAVSKNDAVPVLSGVRVESDGEVMTLAASDRYRLAVAEIPCNGSEGLAVNVPGRVLADTVRMMPGSVQLLHDVEPRTIGLQHESYTFTTRLIDGKYPNFRGLTDIVPEFQSLVDVSDLRDAVKRLSVVAGQLTPVEFRFSSGELHLRVMDGDTAGSETVEARCDFEFRVGLNPQYVLDALAALGSSHVSFVGTVPKRPVVLFPHEERLVAGFQYLVMPMSL